MAVVARAAIYAEFMSGSLNAAAAGKALGGLLPLQYPWSSILNGGQSSRLRDDQPLLA